VLMQSRWRLVLSRSKEEVRLLLKRSEKVMAYLLNQVNASHAERTEDQKISLAVGAGAQLDRGAKRATQFYWSVQEGGHRRASAGQSACRGGIRRLESP